MMSVVSKGTRNTTPKTEYNVGTAVFVAVHSIIVFRMLFLFFRYIYIFHRTPRYSLHVEDARHINH